MKLNLVTGILCLMLTCCTKKTYTSNGERIYKTGKNVRGEKLLNREASRIKIMSSCQTCHGKSGARMKNLSIQFSYLSNPDYFPVPYTDSLFFRFLDED